MVAFVRISYKTHHDRDIKFCHFFVILYSLVLWKLWECCILFVSNRMGHYMFQNYWNNWNNWNTYARIYSLDTIDILVSLSRGLVFCPKPQLLSCLSSNVSRWISLYDVYYTASMTFTIIPRFDFHHCMQYAHGIQWYSHLEWHHWRGTVLPTSDRKKLDESNIPTPLVAGAIATVRFD